MPVCNAAQKMESKMENVTPFKHMDRYRAALKKLEKQLKIEQEPTAWYAVLLERAVLVPLDHEMLADDAWCYTEEFLSDSQETLKEKCQLDFSYKWRGR
jgi:hypothetical protein